MAVQQQPRTVFSVGEGIVITATGVPAVVKFVGTADFATGSWLGVELKEPAGKNDGSVQGVRYFECKAACGLFVRPNMVHKLDTTSKPGDSAAQSPSKRRGKVREPKRISPGSKSLAETSLPLKAGAAANPALGKQEGPLSHPADLSASLRTAASELGTVQKEPSPTGPVQEKNGSLDSTSHTTDHQCDMSQVRSSWSSLGGDDRRHSEGELKAHIVQAPEEKAQRVQAPEDRRMLQQKSTSGSLGVFSQPSQEESWQALLGGKQVPEERRLRALEELTQATEDHDVSKIRQALGEAKAAGVSQHELESACRILAFEVHESALFELDGVRSAVVSLAKVVEAAEARAQQAEQQASKAAQQAAEAVAALAAVRASPTFQFASAQANPNTSAAEASIIHLAPSAAVGQQSEDLKAKERLEVQTLAKLEHRIEASIATAVSRATRDLTELVGAMSNLRTQAAQQRIGSAPLPAGQTKPCTCSKGESAAAPVGSNTFSAFPVGRTSAIAGFPRERASQIWQLRDPAASFSEEMMTTWSPTRCVLRFAYVNAARRTFKPQIQELERRCLTGQVVRQSIIAAASRSPSSPVSSPAPAAGGSGAGMLLGVSSGAREDGQGPLKEDKASVARTVVRGTIVAASRQSLKRVSFEGVVAENA